MPKTSTILARPLVAGCVALAAGSACAHDYPTADRVVFVQACMRDHPNGGYYEMINKCSCAIDTIARDVPFDDFVDMNTATNATSIGGERGSYIRDVESLQQLIRKYRTIQQSAFKACFVDVSSPKP